MGLGLTRIFFFFKSSQNNSKPVLIFWSSIQGVFRFLFVYTLLKVVSYYDLSALSVMGLQKKFGWGGWVGGVSSIQVNFGFLEFV